jgi:hypothetical protein
VIETLSQSLQLKQHDLSNSIYLLDGVKATLLEMRGKFDEEYREVLNWADVLDIEEATPLAGRRSRERNDLQQLLKVNVVSLVWIAMRGAYDRGSFYLQCFCILCTCNWESKMKGGQCL